MPIGGSRKIKKICPCGCGLQIPPYCKPNGRVSCYPKYVPGHGTKHWGKIQREKWATERHPKTMPIGSRRKHDTGCGIYWLLKTTKRGRWQYEHRAVAEEKLGRKLIRGEQVHHINENTLDNRPENLEVLTALEHTVHHLTVRLHKCLFAA